MAGEVKPKFIDLTSSLRGGQIIAFDWTADESDGSVPVSTCPTPVHGFVVKAVTIPDGTTAPTAGYDAVIEDKDGVDVMGGALADRSAVAAEQAVPNVGGNVVPNWVSGLLTLKLTGNAVNSAKGTVKVYIAR
jgi:hypothetical protein